MAVEARGESIAVTVDGRTCTLDRSAAQRLLADLGAALSGSRSFVHTAVRWREDGSVVIERRGADSAGNAKVFDGPAAVLACYRELPERFTAEDVGRGGISGSRRHMLVRFFGEHPGFPCEVVSRRPLTAEKGAGEPSFGPRGLTSAAPGESTGGRP